MAESLGRMASGEVVKRQRKLSVDEH
jgi:hypothetical protein